MNVNGLNIIPFKNKVLLKGSKWPMTNSGKGLSPVSKASCVSARRQGEEAQGQSLGPSETHSVCPGHVSTTRYEELQQ